MHWKLKGPVDFKLGAKSLFTRLFSQPRSKQVTKVGKYTSYAHIYVYMNVSKEKLYWSTVITFKDFEWLQTTLDYKHIPSDAKNIINMGISSETAPLMYRLQKARGIKGKDKDGFTLAQGKQK